MHLTSDPAKSDAGEKQKPDSGSPGTHWWDSVRSWVAIIVAGINLAGVVVAIVVSLVGMGVSEESKQSADAAKAHAETAEKAYQLAVSGSATAKEHANAAKASAASAQSTRDSIEKQVEAAKTANGIASQAAAAADKSASAADESAQSSKRSTQLSAIATARQLRAYISVIGADLRLDASQTKIVASVFLENTGLTPSHQTEFNWTIFCTPRVNGIATGRPFTQFEHEPVAASFGPRAQFTFQKTWDFKTKIDPKFITQKKWDMWIWGTVLFRDEFTLDQHFTNFSFTQGNQTSANPYTWALVYTRDGNNTDVPPRGIFGDILDPPHAAVQQEVDKFFRTPLKISPK